MLSEFFKRCRKNVRTTRMTLFVVLSLAVCFSQLFVSGNAVADDTDFPAIERRFIMGADWVLSLNTTVLDHMLDYPSSLIHPITQIRVTYFTRDQRTQTWSKGQKYEDLWFSSGRPIGSRRYAQLPFANGSYGVIYVVRNKDCYNQTKALDDTILRLYLDLMRVSCVISSVVMPLEICDNAASDLGGFNFYHATIITAGRSILLHFQSSPIKFDQYFVYTVK